MAESKRKGDIGEAMVMADLLRKGHKVAVPVGEDWKYDIIVLINDELKRVQCKYVESDGCVVKVHCRSTNNWNTYRYSEFDFDWIACYDKTSDRCYYVPSKLLGSGRSYLNLRLVAAKNGQNKAVRYAEDFLEIT